MDIRPMLRPLRAAVFAAVCVALTAAGHELAGGHAVGPAALGAGFVVVFAAALAGTRYERSQSAITAGLVAGQVGLHLLFTVTDDPAAVGIVGHPGHMSMATADGAMADDGGLTMLLAHLGAGVVAGWWLRRGEAACWRLLRRAESAAAAALRAALAHLAGIVEGPATDRGPAGMRDVVRHERGGAMTVLLAQCTPRRGPPRGLRTA